MDFYTPEFTRRKFLGMLGAGAAAAVPLALFPEEWLRFVEDGDYAQELVRTPSQTEGPFYPIPLPLETDNDLVRITSKTSPADGKVTHLSGQVLDLSGKPVSKTVVEIWQVDARGAYLHRLSQNRERRDANFQGFGRFETDSQGRYRFRTIKPVSYPGRTPHIHVKVLRGDRELLTTQLYIRGEPQNDRDSVLQGIRDSRARASVIVPFKPLVRSKAGELDAKFNIVLGLTPAERH